MHWVYYLLLLIVLVVGLLMNIVALPGLWVMVAAMAGYAWLTGWNVHVGWPSLVTLVVLALAGEAVELFAGAAGSKAAGGRRRGMIGAVIGAILGAIFLSFIPIIGVAQIVGACLGAFIGAAVAEFWDRDMQHSLRVGVGAAKGRFIGIVGKLALGGVMLIVALITALPIDAASNPVPKTTTPATTIPATTLPATTASS